MLDKLDYHAVAVTGKSDAQDFLLDLGAKEIISREEATQGADLPLLKKRWAGVIDSVGGNILAAAIKATQERGVVLSCGNAASADLHINVYPFILRGVDLLGIDSQNCPMPTRLEIWKQITNAWKVDNLERIISECTLETLEIEIDRILAGKQRGRVDVNLPT